MDLEIISQCIGWTYFASWSLSFYFQLILNYSRQSVAGFSVDFCWLNFYGFICYSCYNIAFYASDSIKDEYRKTWGNDNIVQLNDVYFGLHASVLTGFTILQTFTYPRTIGGPIFNNGEADIPTVSTWVKAFISITAFGVLVLLIDSYLGHAWILDCVYFLSVIKIVITLIKYCPQVMLNYRRQSTEGWSMLNILLDFIGGSLSMSQQVLDAYISRDWSGIYGNPVKLGLGFVSIFFDILFMFQHLVLYRKRFPDIHLAQDEEQLFDETSMLL